MPFVTIDYDAGVYFIKRVDSILDAMETGRMISVDQRLQMKRVVDVAIDKLVEEG